jgi:DNA-directed RNA polymerase specialized sigma24 family protein
MTAVQGGEAMLDVRPSRAEIDVAALDLIERRGAEVLSMARRHAHNDQDAEDAYQRGLEILLLKAPSVEEDVIVPWLKVVVKHEAYAIARERGRAVPAGHAIFDELPGECDGEDTPDRIDTMRVGSEALSRLKPQETRCLVLLAQGYSYEQIQSATGFSYTKVNRCLAEGRKAFFARVRGIESGAECERWAPLLSRVADGEASSEDMEELRPHIKGCASCRATLREYYEAPRQLTLLLGPLGFAAATAGGAKAGGAWFSFAALQKAAAGVAATAALAGGGAVAVHEMDVPPPRPSHAAHAVAARPTAAAPKATAAPVSASSSHARKRTKKQPKPKPTTPKPMAQPIVRKQAFTPSPPVTPKTPPSPPSKPSTPSQPPADPGGEFGP